MKLETNAIALGVLTLVAVTTLISLVVGRFLVDIYSDAAVSGRFSPQYVAYIALLSLLQFGVPAYIAATVATASKVFNAFVVGLFGSLIAIAFSWPGPKENPSLALATSVVAIGVAMVAGKLRQLRRRS